jgi:hypothetical protein
MAWWHRTALLVTLDTLDDGIKGAGGLTFSFWRRQRAQAVETLPRGPLAAPEDVVLISAVI